MHGGAAAPGVLDFSAGISPLPPPAAVLSALRAADVTRYPHPTALPIRAAAARAHGLQPGEIVAGSGSTELIWALARAYCGPGRTACVLTPAFGEYAQAVLAQGGRVIAAPAGASLCWDAISAVRTARDSGASLVFACRPSNPCLSALTLDDVATIAAALPSALVVVDEAYLPLFDGLLPVSPGPNVAVLRSLTKLFALPGLRLGYLLASAPVARAVQAALPPWTVSSPAQAAGVAAFECLEQAPTIRREIGVLRRVLVDSLQRSGANVVAQGGTFVLCAVPRASDFCARLALRGARVRDCTSFGLPDHVRVGVRPEAETLALARGWKEAS